MKTLEMLREHTAGTYTVTASPAVALGKARAYFDGEWPYARRDGVQVHGPDVAGREVLATLPGHIFMGSVLGFITLAFFSLITFGTFFVLWAIVAYFVSAELGPTVKVSVARISERETRLTVKTNSAEHAKAVCEFIEREFVPARSQRQPV